MPPLPLWASFRLTCIMCHLHSSLSLGKAAPAPPLPTSSHRWPPPAAPQDVPVRLSVKMFNVHPQELPPALLAELQQLVAADPVSLLGSPCLPLCSPAFPGLCSGRPSQQAPLQGPDLASGP